MKRSEMFEKIEVACPDCPKTRTLNKSSYKGNLSVTPYVQACGCLKRKQKKMSEEAIEKIRKANEGKRLSEETKEKIRQYRKDHPELWVTLQRELGPIARIGTHHTEETKKKISKSVKLKKDHKDE